MQKRTIEIDDRVVERIKEALVDEINRYATNRQSDIARGAETEVLAGLIIEKYGYGLNEAATIMFDILGLPRLDITDVVDAAQEAVDPEAKMNRKLRWDARPATVDTAPAA